MRMGTIYIRPDRVGGQLTGRFRIDLESHLGDGETVALRLHEKEEYVLRRARLIQEALNDGLPAGFSYVLDGDS
jgi:hypothetical protein